MACNVDHRAFVFEISLIKIGDSNIAMQELTVRVYELTVRTHFLLDLSLCDCFLWGYLKFQVFKSRPQTIDELNE